MSTAQSPSEHEMAGETSIKHDEIWAVDMGDGIIGFRLADTTPPQAYDKLAFEFSDKLDSLKQQLEHTTEVTVGTATLKRHSTGCIEITTIESSLDNHTVTWN